MEDVWQSAEIKKETFAAAASLFAILTKRQSVCTTHVPSTADSDHSSSEEDIKDDLETTIPCAKLHRTVSNVLIDRFLDRLSELLAREKSITIGTRQKQTSAKHVAAAAWINADADSPTTILVAKNEGCHPRDRTMLKRLQIWLRTVSMTGKAPLIEKDLIWIRSGEHEGLVGYSRNRLEAYVSQIQHHKFDDKLLDNNDPASLRLRHLVELCSKFDDSSTVLDLSKIVDQAYELRRGDWHFLKKLYGTKVIKAVLMIGRVRAAYECFKTTALSFPKFAHVQLQSAERPDTVDVDAIMFRKQLEKLAKHAGRERLTNDCSGVSRLYIHAEMQILVKLETQPKWRQSAHSYIGTSKRPCFLCHELMQNYARLSSKDERSPTFRARLSHGKVYPLWALPSIPASADRGVCLTITAALKQTYCNILQSLSAKSKSLLLQPAMAESSVGISRITEYDGRVSHKLKSEYLARQRNTNSCTVEENDSYTFGPEVKKVQVLRLPADGSSHNLVPIAFHKLPSGSSREVPEPALDLMPDFRKYWGLHHSDRKLGNLSIGKRPIREVEGSYRIYHNESTELPENELIKRMLALDHVDPSRRFYHGDLFVVKLLEDPTTPACSVLDIPQTAASRLVKLMRKVLLAEWSEEYLESKLREEQYLEELALKEDRDREILYQRMTPIERDLLGPMLPNTLDYLAMYLCDDDAVISSSRKPTSDPDMVKIEVIKKPRALDVMDWTGFQSSQL